MPRSRAPHEPASSTKQNDPKPHLQASRCSSSISQSPALPLRSRRAPLRAKLEPTSLEACRAATARTTMGSCRSLLLLTVEPVDLLRAKLAAPIATRIHGGAQSSAGHWPSGGRQTVGVLLASAPAGWFGTEPPLLLVPQQRRGPAHVRSSPRRPPNAVRLLRHHVSSSSSLACWLLRRGCVRPPRSLEVLLPRSAPPAALLLLPFPHHWAVPEGQDALCVLHCRYPVPGDGQHARQHPTTTTSLPGTGTDT